MKKRKNEARGTVETAPGRKRRVHSLKAFVTGFSGILVMLVLGSLWASGGGSSLAATYNRGNRLYEEGEYSEAIRVYSELAAAGAVNGFLFYNLGNAYFKEGEIGSTILWYSRARRILPRDRDVITNLEFARRVRPDKIEGTRLPAVFRMLRVIVFGLNLSELTLVAFILYLLTMLSVMALILAKRAAIRRIASRASLVLGAVLCLSLILLGGRIYHANGTMGCVIMVGQVDAMSGPGSEYTKVMSLHEGTEAQIEEEREGWYLIKLPNGLGGWIPSESVEVI